MADGCLLGHRRYAYECPACAETRGRHTTVEQWRWFRGRTSSRKIKERIDSHLAALTESEKP